MGHEPFAVLLGDDLIDPRDPLLSTMIAVREQFGGSVIALMEVPPEQVNLYGCAAVQPIEQADDDVVLVTGLVEKPPVEEAPSNLAVIGRYLLDPSVFDVLRQTQPGRGGEIQLTDALQHLAVSRMAGARGARRGLPRSPLRHRRPVGVPQGGRPAGQRACRARRGLPFVAGRVRGTGSQRVISVEEHVRRILDTVHALPPADLTVDQAQDCVLAEDVVSPIDLPGFDNSAMDGYAVITTDVAGASETSPVTLPVVGDLAAGSTDRARLVPGQTIRIMTGAPLPDGADAVVPVEQTDRGVVQVRIRASAGPRQHVRATGSDVRRGDLVLEGGGVIGPAQVALLYAVGRRRVRVHPKPRVAVLSTGSELVQDRMPGYGEVIDSNGPMLAACVQDAGAIAYRVGVVPDDPHLLMETLTDQLMHADAVITSGGVSAGAYDTVKEVLSRLGTVQFGKVAMQPGMPQGFGTIGEAATPIFTLPGNPVSAFVSFEIFVRPALRRLAGHQGVFRRSEHAVAVKGWTAPAGKVQFARAVIGVDGEGRRTVQLVGSQGSHVLGGLALANCLAVVPEEVTEVHEGDLLRCILLERGRR